MEWERGETTPGAVMKELKVGGLRDLLEGLASAPPAEGANGLVGAARSRSPVRRTTRPAARHPGPTARPPTSGPTW